MEDFSNSREFLLKNKYAIIGATNDRSKYGNIVFRNLKAKGYTVYPVNPGAEHVEGEQCYPNISSLPEPVDGIITVVPPKVTEKVVQEAAEAGIRRVWMQEGSESREAIEYCKAHGMSTIYYQCVMVESNYRKLWENEGS